MKYYLLKREGTSMSSKYNWCLHCNRTYLKGALRLDRDYKIMPLLEMCPYPDCDGDIHQDGFDWDEFRKMSKQNDLPEIPFTGVAYHQ
jgi:hypothetical protein